MYLFNYIFSCILFLLCTCLTLYLLLYTYFSVYGTIQKENNADRLDK